jgi:hypothetical protein
MFIHAFPDEMLGVGEFKTQAAFQPVQSLLQLCVPAALTPKQLSIAPSAAEICATQG